MSWRSSRWRSSRYRARVGIRIEQAASLINDQIEAVQRLVHSAPGAADNPPISESALLALPSSSVEHFLASQDGDVRGYAQLDAGGNAELVADEVGIGAELLAAIGRTAGFRLWAHGEASVANQVAQRVGLTPVRTLLQLRRTLPGLVLPEPVVPDGVRIRAFVPGQDDERWLAVNARAFANHPEQGAWTQQDLAERLAAPWFDPAGFFLAWQGENLIGYHWTKVHIDLEPPIGEVYVLGIDPAAQGLRLGTLLLNEGLRFLQAQGLATVLLYVEADNPTAVHLYEKAGFTLYSSDIQYAAG
jgi:mycothiol synthase